ncbi:hypothetical protein ACF3DV_26850 [Chlorogloeopsis fritschii PCC 9212]|uniref:hypothetical protein n=1 Tax=Chlorogloeopsis fritschii TaxID=1124 RepID=UPI000F8F4E49
MVSQCALAVKRLVRPWRSRTTPWKQATRSVSVRRRVATGVSAALATLGASPVRVRTTEAIKTHFFSAI